MSGAVANSRRALERKLAEAIDGHSAAHSHHHGHHNGLCVGFCELVHDCGPAEFTFSGKPHGTRPVVIFFAGYG